MNRKNTILIAVLINAGLLAVLLIAALTTQNELPNQAPLAREEILERPLFDEQPLIQELPVLAVNEPFNLPEIAPSSDPVLHALPLFVPESAPPEIAAAPSLPSFTEVTVKKGDSLERIAKTHHTTVDGIIKLNHLPSSLLKIGQVLKIPAERSLAKAAEKKPAEAGPEYYTIKVGENPWGIAIRHHMKLDELLRLNGLNEEKARKLKAGDRLRIR